MWFQHTHTSLSAVYPRCIQDCHYAKRLTRWPQRFHAVAVWQLHINLLYHLLTFMRRHQLLSHQLKQHGMINVDIIEQCLIGNTQILALQDGGWSNFAKTRWRSRSTLVEGVHWNRCKMGKYASISKMFSWLPSKHLTRTTLPWKHLIGITLQQSFIIWKWKIRFFMFFTFYTPN